MSDGAPEQARRTEAAAVMLAREANRLSAILGEAVSFSERTRRQRNRRTAFVILVGVLFAVLLHDQHAESCVIHGPTSALGQVVCDATFPLHEHAQRTIGADPIETPVNGRVVGLVLYGALMTVGAAIALRREEPEVEGVPSHHLDDRPEWKRTQQAFQVGDPTYVELTSAFLLSLWGMWLLLPWPTFSSFPAAYEPMKFIAPEWVWGLVFTFVSSAATWGTYLGKEAWRRVGGIGLFLAWLLLASTFAVAGPTSTAVPIYGGLAYASGWAVYRRTRAYLRSKDA